MEKAEVTHSSILNALRVIRKVCRDAEDCTECPLRLFDGCLLTEVEPKSFKLTDEEIVPWRAFVVDR